MALGTFTLSIDGDRIGGDVETTAYLALRPQNPAGVIKDPDADKFFFKPVSKNISLPYTIELPTDVVAGGGDSATIGFHIDLTTVTGARISSDFAAKAAGSTVSLTDVVENVVIPVADSTAAAIRAEAAATDAQASAGDAATSAAAAKRVAGQWAPDTAYAADQVVLAPDGTLLSRVAAGISRATFDATEQAAWVAVSAKDGTIEKQALAAAIAVGITPHVASNIDVSALSAAAAQNVPSVLTQNTAAFRASYRSLLNSGDYAEWDVTLGRGKWVLGVETLKASGGQFQITVDGTLVGTVDTYSTSGTTAAIDNLPVVTVQDPGVKRIRLTLSGKNASSSAYTCRISGFTLNRVGAKLPDAFSWTLLDTDFKPHSVGVDGRVYGHTSTRQLCYANHDGTLVLGRNIGEYTVSGEYVIWTAHTSAGYLAVTSSDVSQAGNFGGIYFGPTLTGAFTKVQAIKGTNELSIAMGQGANGQTHVMVGEYSTDLPQPTHYLWLSKDGGQTWASVKTAVVKDTTKNSHFHASLVDSSRTPVRYWSSQGDNQNSIFAYSDDECVTWHEVPIPTNSPLYQSDAADPQPTLLGVFPQTGILFSTPDRGRPSAVWTQPSDGTGSPLAKWVSPMGEASENQFGRGPFVQSGDVAVMVIPDRFSGTKQLYMVATGDAGLSWHLLYTVNMGTNGGGASLGIVGPDSDGYIYWLAENYAAPDLSKLHVAPLPTFSV